MENNEQIKLNIKQPIQFKALERVDIRIGKIESVEKVDGSERLYKLSVNFGTEQKTVVSAIADKISQEDLLGKRMPFVMNLEPRKIFGILSEAMIVMAENSDKSLHPIFSIGAEPGSIIF